ncbi:SBBP repeat-containing protein [Spirulina sp. 06S082]|uniref:SBBP repeat-containing protein n=1 Tax=Spirulina sp. 06S082 TaxID=3110248 RepID=UPI002B1EA815|nr:SBBP repeat-containing protein [Spirulina sp. 06S082]MEA5469800.1 SBBP repeat-containing protein [Spirulina sp. 06S082]
MSPTTTKNGVDPGLKIDSGTQSLFLASEFSDPLQSSPLSPGSSSPPPPEHAARQWLQQLGSANDEGAADIVVDGAGNSYIAGSTTGSLFSQNRGRSDGWLAKFNSNGDLMWGRQIGTVSFDSASQIALDGSGNIYIAGITTGLLEGTPSGSFGNILLAKYDSNGTPFWVQQHNFNGPDSLSDMEVTPGGLVYLTGQSYGGTSSATLRHNAWAAQYLSNGNLMWEKQYSLDFFGRVKDITSNGIAVDASLNSYVAIQVGGWKRYGRSIDFDSSSVWNEVWHPNIESDGTGSLVSKYDPFGTLIWQKYLDFSVGWNGILSDRIAADNLGNFYLGNNNSLGKYNSNGDRLWLQDFTTTRTATDIATDVQGNAYLSGWSGSNNAWSAKYNHNGTFAWEQEFGTPESDRAYGIAVDSTGKVYLAGSTRGTLGQANTGGEDIWLAQYLQMPGDPNHAPESLRFSLDRVQYKATDTLTLKNGWVQDLDGAIDLARVDLQLLDINGTAIDLASITDFTPASWSSDWTAFNTTIDLSHLNLTGGNYRLIGVSYDRAGAASSPFERKFSILTNTAPGRLQFSLDNNQYEANETLNLKNAWVYDIDGSNDIAHIDFELIDAMGNAIDLADVAQFTPATWSHQWANFDYSLNLAQLGLDLGIYSLRGTAYDRAGAKGSSFERKFQLNLPSVAALTWVQDTARRGNDIAIDNAGNLYVTGTAFNSIINDPNTFTGDDIWIAKYDRNGNLLWQEEWGTTKTDSAEGITVDGLGNVYLTGSTEGDLNGINAGRDDVWLAKYDRDGNRIWVEQLGTTDQDDAVDVAIDSNGDRDWLQQFGTNAFDNADDITVDDAGNIYLTGGTQGSLAGTNVGLSDIWVRKYDSTGNFTWQEQWGTDDSERVEAIAVDGGNLYLVGQTGLNGVDPDNSWIVKYA